MTAYGEKIVKQNKSKNDAMGSYGKEGDLQFYNIIDGKARASKEHHQGVDPRTEEPLWDVPVASTQDLDDAVAAARRAFKTWKNSTLAERRDKIEAAARCAEENVDLLASILMRETGKSRLMAEIEIARTANHFRYYSKANIFILLVMWIRSRDGLR